MECEFCQALLVEVFESNESDEAAKTDPIQVFGLDHSTDTDALLRAAQEIDQDDAAVDNQAPLQRLPRPPDYTGELPRFFRFGNRYQILEKVGEGGMGRVYKALDLELDRPVALKTIRPEKGKSREVLERFKQELILARKITHKNVIRIYDLGESDGMKFFTMELIEGENLRETLQKRKKIPVKECLSLMTQILSGLGEAHRQGVVHRDLKPQNIMVDQEDVVRIMDFGIARTADSATMTGTGEMMGTPDYISPEQVKGDTADAKSDLYACGVILFELLTGETPFKGDTPIAKIVARLQVKPPSPRDKNSEIPGYLERIVLKCLEVDPELRYQNAEEVLQDLEREQVDRSLWLRLRKSVAHHKAWVATACLAASLGIGYAYYSSLPSPLVAADVAVTSIAVLPFSNVTNSEEWAWMVNGIPELLVTDISQFRSLRAVTTNRIDQILEDLGKAGQSRFDEGTVRVIAEMAASDLALHGKFVESGGQLRIEMTLVDLGTGVSTPLRVDGSTSELFPLVDALTEKVTAAANVDLLQEAIRPLTEVSTDSIRAFRTYHDALGAMHSGGHQLAIPLLEEALELDPTFAMAYARLAEAHFYLGNDAAAQQAVREAEKRAETSALPLIERYEINAIAARIDDDPERAVRNYQELAKLYPDEPQVQLSLASSLETMGQIDEAIEKYRHVIELSPKFGEATLGLGRMLVLSGQSEAAIPALHHALESGDFEKDLEALGMIHSILGVAHRTLSDYESAISELQKSLSYRRAAENDRGVTATYTNLAGIYATLGRVQEARELLQEGLAIAKSTDNSTMESFALVNLGEVNQGAGDLREALANYSESLEIEWERGEHTELADRLNVIGSVYSQLGRYADATVYLEQARLHIEKANDPAARGYNLLMTARIHQAKGNYESAIEAFLSAIPLLRDTGQLPEVAGANEQLAEIYLQQGRDEDARAAVEQSLATNEQLRVPIRLAETKIHEALYQVAMGQTSAAEDTVSKAEKLLAELDGGRVLILLQLAKGKIQHELGSPDSSMKAFEAARDLARESGYLLLEQRARLELSRSMMESGDSARVDAELTDIIKVSKRRRLRPLEAEACLLLAETYLRSSDSARAEAMIGRAVSLASEFGGARLLGAAKRLRAQLEQELAGGEEL
ncbi:MAG: tetratricopeptide repeat protein [Acidobacteria bacterium]|nr:MAG: tetratricopeptide repeat protein [Acidobacteriota bacterium]